jgi:aminopeptidase N
MKRFLLFAPIVFLLVNCQVSEIPVTTGVTAELAKHRKTIISEIQYDLGFSIPSKMNEKVKASSTISFDLKNADQNLQLDFKGDTTATYTVICNGQTTELPITNGHLVIGKSFLKKGQNKLSLIFISPDWSLNRNPEFMYTLFVPDRASTAFPCFDQPDLKAQFSLQLEIPVAWKAVANGAVLHQETADSVKHIRFSPTKPLPTYLFAFSAGVFDTISQTKNGRTCVLYHREKEEESLRNNVDSIFKLLFRSIDEIEQYTAIKYPFEKYDLVAIPSFQYNGMEHPGTTLYRASSLFLDAKPTRQDLLKRANLVAHETSHMWFGDLVTMPWFDEVWLKEVFANFIADKVVAPIFPEFNFDLQFLMAHYQAAYSVDRTSGANAITQKLANMKDAGSLYGSIIYHKAPIVMNLLEQKIGEEKLRDGLRKYLRGNEYGNAGWQELIDILNSPKADELPKWSDSWVKEAGRPEIRAKVEGKTLIVEQTDPSGKGRIWPLELEIAHPVKGQVTIQKAVLNAGKLSLENFFTGANPLWIYLNAKGNVYGFVVIDTLSQNYFLKNLSLTKDDLLRASVLTDLTENLYEKKLSSDKYLKMLISSIPKEPYPVIYERMLIAMETCFLYKTTDAQRLAYRYPLESLLWDEYAVRKAQKTAIMNTLIKLSCTHQSLDKLQDFMAGKYSKDAIVLSAEQQTELALQLALKIPEKAKEILDNQENRITNPDKKAEFLFVRQSVQPEKAGRDRFFNQLLKAQNREHEPWVDRAMTFLNHPVRQKETLEYIRPALDALLEIQQTGDIFFPKSWLDNLLKGHSSPEAGAIVKQFLTDHPNYPEDLKMKILQSADHLLRNVK